MDVDAPIGRIDFYVGSTAPVRLKADEPLNKIVPRGRVELPTPGLGNLYSIQLSYRGLELLDGLNLL